MRSLSLLSLALAGALALGCGSACPRAALCGASSWATTPSAGGAFVVLPVVQVVSPSGPSDTRVDVRSGGVTLLGFDARALAGRGRVARAMLSLVPHPSWRPAGQRLRLQARAVRSGWSAGGGDPSGGPTLDTEPCAELVLPAGSRTPLRIDVTAALAALGGRALAGVALQAEGGEASFVGAWAEPVAWRPRVEVELAPR